MGKHIYFRYKEAGLYEEFTSYLDFIKAIPLKVEEIEELDEFGYNILHYCAFKSNITSDVLEYVLSFNPNMYILSGVESLTAFELAFIKNAMEKLEKFDDCGYDCEKEDELGFFTKDKIEGYVSQNPSFYKNAIDKYKIDLKVFDETKESNSFNTKLKENKKKDDNDVLALRLRIEMENRLFEIVKARIGKELEDLIINKSLHELILNSYSLGLISYEKKEVLFKAKQVLNHFCHYQVIVDNRIEWFLNLSKNEKENYFVYLQQEIEKI